MKVDFYGRVTVTEDEAFESLYRETVKYTNLISLESEAAIEQFNRAIDFNKDSFAKLSKSELLTCTVEEFDDTNQKKWLMPNTSESDNLADYLYSKCTTSEQIERVTTELELFYKHDMIEVLRFLKYLVDTMRRNKILWGVGRGSSVASYCLYLLGVHKVDSIKYELDIGEFLK